MVSSSLVKIVTGRNMVRKSEQPLHGTVAKRIAKRRKVARNSLCNLPMDILSTILSLLPINDAVRTSVLSRKLKCVWCSHTNLKFDQGTMRKGYFRPSKGYHSALMEKDFVTRVDTVLQQHSGTGVEHMKIWFWLHSKHADHIDSWVSFAIVSKTKEFVLNLSGGSRGSFFKQLSCGGRMGRMVGEEAYCFPSQFFSPNNCSHLRCLELWSVSLQLPSDFKGLLNLKSLKLVDVSITDEDVQCMLSKCNHLEFLEIAYCSTVTSIRMLHPMDRLMHLVVDICPKLQEIELNCSPTTLQYSGHTMVPLKFASKSRLTNINVAFSTYQSALSYMVTGFPSTSPRLKTLTLYCYECERTIVPEGPFRFTCLRNLRLDLVLNNNKTRNVDVLDYAYLLKIAPFMETMELRMRMRSQHLPYCKEDGELRTGLPHQHTHLKYVRMSGFFGHKDQLELALHILGSCMVLEKMKIIPKLEITSGLYEPPSSHYKQHYADGHRVATEFVCKADHRNVVKVVRVPAKMTTLVAPGPRDGKEQKRRAVVLTT